MATCLLNGTPLSSRRVLLPSGEKSSLSSASIHLSVPVFPRSSSLTIVAAAKKKTKAKRPSSSPSKPKGSSSEGGSKLDGLRPRNPSFNAGEAVDGKIPIRVDLTGEDTKWFFDKVLVELAKTCPPVPGAQLRKGGKAARVEPFEVLRLVGPRRVSGFCVDQLVSSSLQAFVETNGLNANKEAKTVQEAAELMELFEPGQPFGFDAVLELVEESTNSESGVPEEVVQAA